MGVKNNFRGGDVLLVVGPAESAAIRVLWNSKTSERIKKDLSCVLCVSCAFERKTEIFTQVDWLLFDTSCCVFLPFGHYFFLFVSVVCFDNPRDSSLENFSSVW